MSTQAKLQAMREICTLVQEKKDSFAQEEVVRELDCVLLFINKQIQYLVRDDAYERNVPRCANCNLFMFDGGETMHGVQMCTERCAPEYRDSDSPKWMDPNWEGNMITQQILAQAARGDWD